MKSKQQMLRTIRLYGHFTSSYPIVTLHRLNFITATYYIYISLGLLGKFGQDTSTKVSTIAISSQKELDDLFWKEDVTIEDYIVMSPHVVEVSVKNKSSFNRPNLKSNAIIAAHVTSYARIEMDRAIRILLAQNISIYYSDTGKLLRYIKYLLGYVRLDCKVS